MRFVLLSVLALLLQLVTFSQSPTRQEIPFELLPSGHILVKAKVAGVEGRFIFDTGGGITVFTKTFFNKLPNTTAEDGGFTGFRATGERLDLNLYQVKNVEFGPLKKASEVVSHLDMNLGGIDGILSLKLLETQPFTIDLNKKVIRLETTTTMAGIKKKAQAIPVQLQQYREKSLTLFAYFKVNDTLNLQFSLDSGAGKDVFRVNAKYLQPLGVNTQDTAHVKKIERRSEINQAFVSAIYTTRLNKMSATAAPAIQTANFPVQFVEGLIYDGIIWINWLGSQITIDLPGKMMLVQR